MSITHCKKSKAEADETAVKYDNKDKNTITLGGKGPRAKLLLRSQIWNQVLDLLTMILQEMQILISKKSR